MFNIILHTALIILTLSLGIFLLRVFIGPSISDRILGLDSLGMALVGFIGLIMILQETMAYADVILVLSILAFVGTVSLSKFVERGAVFDRD